LPSFSQSEIGISTITLSELEYGIAKSSRPDQNREALIEFLTPLEIVSFDEKGARYYGEIRALLRVWGQT
jgi:tRNA(fMet)-specific endonuclease VapC